MRLSNLWLFVFALTLGSSGVWAAQNVAPWADKTVDEIWKSVKKSDLWATKRAFNEVKKGTVARISTKLTKKVFKRWELETIRELAYYIARSIRGIDASRQEIIRKALNYLYYSVKLRGEIHSSDDLWKYGYELTTVVDNKVQKRRLCYGAVKTLESLQPKTGLLGDSKKTEILKKQLTALVEKAKAFIPRNS
ncbi:MAG: hypothetical protein M1549_00680 [Candidatus Dependentiae bacterium]|jgi:hypothetical protein|nr:hypothetical protein [Candidatus Dependentiae bacterium]